MITSAGLVGILSATAGAAEWPDLREPPQGLDRAGGKEDAALIVAVEDYAFLPDVPGAARNADDWEAWMLQRGVPGPHVHMVVDRQGDGEGSPVATKEEILRRARLAASSVGPRGTLWVVFIGHGAPAKNDVHLLGVDTSRSVEGFASRGVTRTELLAALQSEAAHTVAVLDTCFSGQGVAGEALLAEPLQPVLLTSLAAAGQPALELLATSRDQYAGPLPGGDRPAFSYLVLGALRGWGDEAVGAEQDGVITASEAVAYAGETLRMLLSGRSQEPTIHAPDEELLEFALGEGKERGPDRVALRQALGQATATTGATVSAIGPVGGAGEGRKGRRGSPPLRVAGALLAGVGAVAIVVPWALAPGVPEQSGGGTALKVVNTAGWALAAGGSGLFVSSFVVQGSPTSAAHLTPVAGGRLRF